MEYRQEIDGLRALAVLPVILYHAAIPGFAGGFVGVDVFFVISGYLITSIIAKELSEDRFSVANFYERRARRILPALFFVIIASFALAWFALLPKEFVEYARSLVSIAAFVSNIEFYLSTDYFDRAAELKLTLHTWSLAVEEQFYVIFPVLMALIWFIGRKWVLALMVAGLVLSFGLAEYVNTKDLPLAFYMLPTRAWELLAGAIPALILSGAAPERKSGWQQLFALSGIALIGISVVFLDDTLPFPGLYAVAPVLGSVLIIMCAAKGTLAHTILTRRVFVGIGLISYSAYLWHQPLLAAARNYYIDPPEIMLAALALLSIGAAWFSWRFVEAPFRKRDFLTRSQVFALSAAGLGAIAVLGVAGIATEGFEGRSIEQRFRSPVLAWNPDNRALQTESWTLLRAKTGESDYAFIRNESDTKLWFDLDDERAKLLIVGNSHSKDIYNVIAQSGYESRAQLARYGMQISQFDSRLYKSPNYRNADIVLIASRYWPGDEGAIQDAVGRMVEDGKRVGIVPLIFEQPVFGHGRMTLADKLVLEEQWSGLSEPTAIAERVNSAGYETITQPRPPEDRKYDEAIKRAIVRYPQIVVLDRTDYICHAEHRRCAIIEDDLSKNFYDEGHHTLIGAQRFAKRIDELGWLDPLLSGVVEE
ncbi:MAG: acyltransferase family protein [Pseudomonadota bacterium]